MATLCYLIQEFSLQIQHTGRVLDKFYWGRFSFTIDGYLNSSMYELDVTSPIFIQSLISAQIRIQGVTIKISVK